MAFNDAEGIANLSSNAAPAVAEQRPECERIPGESSCVNV